MDVFVKVSIHCWTESLFLFLTETFVQTFITYVLLICDLTLGKTKITKKTQYWYFDLKSTQ